METAIYIAVGTAVVAVPIIMIVLTLCKGYWKKEL